MNERMDYLKAEKDTDYHRHEFATLVVNVTKVATQAPTITSSVPDFTGYIPENSAKNTLLLNAAQDTPFQLSATDLDRVR